MNILENFGLYVVRALGFLAQWLGELTSPFPWPLIMALAAVPLLFIANFTIWFLRGAIWPVHCKHQATTVRRGGDSACRNMVIGEWRYCKNHNKDKVNSRNKWVNSDLPRWKNVHGDDRIDIDPINNNVSMFFYHGFVRRPKDASDALKEFWPRLLGNIDFMTSRIKNKSNKKDSLDIKSSTPEQRKYNAFHPRAKRADQALFLLKWLLPLAFLMIATSTFIRGPWTTVLEYVALLLLWIVVEIIRKGLLLPQGDLDWRLQALLGTIKGFGLVVIIAISSVLLDGYIMPFIEKVTT